MKNLKVLIKQKKDKTEFKIQEYKQNENTKKWSIDNDVKIYTLLETFIIKDIESGNNVYNTHDKKNSKLTKVKVRKFINESTKKHDKTLITEHNSTVNDNLNNLPMYE